MKKIFSILAIGLLFVCSSEAQTVTSLKNADYQTLTIDTVTNTGTGSLIINLTQAYKNVTIQPKVTKISGTITSNSAPKLQGSIDGTNYFNIVGDTMNVTNTSSLQTTAWVKSNQGFKYYKVTYTGVGTMSAKLEALILVVK